MSENLSEWTDEELWKGYHEDGRADAFEEIYARHEGTARKSAIKVFWSPRLKRHVNDVVQNTFILLIESPLKFRPKELGGSISEVAKYKAHEIVRKEKRFVELSDSPEAYGRALDEAVAWAERLDFFIKILERLTEEQRTRRIHGHARKSNEVCTLFLSYFRDHCLNHEYSHPEDELLARILYGGDGRAPKHRRQIALDRWKFEELFSRLGVDVGGAWQELKKLFDAALEYAGGQLDLEKVPKDLKKDVATAWRNLTKAAEKPWGAFSHQRDSFLKQLKGQLPGNDFQTLLDMLGWDDEEEDPPSADAEDFDEEEDDDDKGESS